MSGTFNGSSVPPSGGSFFRGWSSAGIQANFAPPDDLNTIPSQSGALQAAATAGEANKGPVTQQASGNNGAAGGGGGGVGLGGA